MRKRFALAVLLMFPVAPTMAAPKTATLMVEGMTCAACPFTVQMALRNVEGVSEVNVSYENHQAVVTFDDSQTSVSALTEATTNAGYPSTVKELETGQE